MKAPTSSYSAAFLLAFAATVSAQTVFLDPGFYPGDTRGPVISGFNVESQGFFWWDNGPNCSVEFRFSGKAGYKNRRSSTPRRFVSHCQINPDRSSPARDEAYVYYFQRVGSDNILHRKSLNAPEADPGVPFEANGNMISIDSAESSRTWVDGDYLYYQLQWFNFIGGTWSTRLYRTLRDGTSNPVVFASLPGQQFITEFEPFVYLHFGSPFSVFTTGHLILTESRNLYTRDKDGLVNLSRQNVYDFAVQPPGGLSNVSTVYTAENTGGEGNAVARLYRVAPVSGSGDLLRTWNGYHFLEVELANWPNNARGRVFLTRAIPGPFGLYGSFTCQRQLTQGSFVNWDQFLGSNFEARLEGSPEWVYYVHDGKIKGKRSDAPPEEIDVQLLGIEVTQGVQSLSHSAVLVAGKPTYLRGFARLSENTTTQTDWYAGARLYGSRGGNPLPGSPLSPVDFGQLTTSDTLPNQRNLGGGYLFELPSSWTTGTPTFDLRLNESGGVPETGSDANNGFATLNFVNKERTCLKFRPLKTVVSPYYAETAPGLPAILRRCESMIPVSGLDVRFNNNLRKKPVFFVEIEYVPCFPFVCPVPIIKIRQDPFRLQDTSDNDGSWAIFWLGVDRLFENDPCDDYHLVGTVHPSLANFNGIGGRGDLDLTELWDEFPPVPIPDSDWASVLVVKMRTDTAQGALMPGADAGDVPFNTTYGGRTLAHELAHNYGRKHINQNTSVCGGSTPEGPYHNPPFNTCTFGDSSSTSAGGAVAGFDTVHGSIVRNDLGIFGDLLSYADARWTSVWNWNAVADRIPNGGGGAPPQPPAPGGAAGTWIVVKGFYDPNTGEAMLMPSEILPDGIIPPAKLTRALEAEAAMPDATPIEICQLAADGSVLRQHKAVPFAIPREGDAPPDQLWFLQVIPCDPDMASIVLCDEDEPVAWLPRSMHAPQLTVHSPVHDAANELLHLSWSASDPDGSPLVFSVFYSPDNGASWRALDDSLDTTALTISTRRLPGGASARIRVIACDGMDTAISESPPFTLPLSPPDILVDGLPENARVPYGQPVKPLLFACDDEDGVLTPQWNLSGPSPLSGTGAHPCLLDLAPGAYTLAVTASDTHGMDTQVQRHFEVLPVVVPDGTAPVLDGHCADATYLDAATIKFRTGSDQIVTNLIHANGRLYVTICNIPYAPGSPLASAGLLVDTDGEGDVVSASDRGFFVDEDGIPWQSIGRRTSLEEQTEPPLGFLTAVQRGTTTWSAEFCIDEDLVGGWDHAARLFIQLDLGRADEEWPANAGVLSPDTWAAAWLGDLPAPPNQAPVAIVPAQIVAVASEIDSITLDGNASEDPDGDELTFTWSQIAGPVVTLQNPDTAQASFMPPAVPALRLLVFDLTVRDGTLPSAPAQLTVLLLPDPPAFVEEGVAGSGLILVDVEYLDLGDLVRLDFAGQPGQDYDIERSDDGIAWQTIGSETAGVTGIFSHTDPYDPAAPRLYRARERE